ncbi:hypothetical protein K0M31_002156 [Melipona bicolor]|uniref:Uncharacterized protein n=1 Tax=Melipona bicolor TaxID=60889 RepID=A0AA40KYL5_9HYME|nr:hypothetical protein K0M31_002156 [Melipona bicolor]
MDGKAGVLCWQFCHILLSQSGERAIPGEWNASQITEARIKLRGSSNVSQTGPEPFCPITGGALMQPSEKITTSASVRRYRSDRPMREVNREHGRREPTVPSLCRCTQQCRILKDGSR